MSHNKLRTETNCLNCNAVVSGRFCSVCGQENVEIHETFGHLAGHLISDIFHFDGMFFSTAKSLLFKPGFLTYEYMRGRRASYLNPVKMYVFISAVFFLLFLSFFKPEIDLENDNNGNLTVKQAQTKMLGIRQGLTEVLKDSAKLQIVKERTKQKLALVDKDLALLQKDTTRKKELLDDVNALYIGEDGAIIISENDYKTVAQYDSLQKIKPEKDRDGWITRKMTERSILLEKEFSKDKKGTANALEESFFHHFPQMLFISLPLFALVLQLLYRRRKEFNFGSHIIFTVHLYCAMFIFIFLAMILNRVAEISWLFWMIWINYAVVLYAIFYSYKAMYVYYAQSHGKTIAKWLILYVMVYFILLLLFVGLLLFTFFIV